MAKQINENQTTMKEMEEAKEVQAVKKEETEKQYDNEKRIVLFQNNQRTNLKHPIMRGNFVLNGKTYNVSLWTKVFIKDGKEEYYMQGQISEPEETGSNATENVQQFMDKNQAKA